MKSKNQPRVLSISYDTIIYLRLIFDVVGNLHDDVLRDVLFAGLGKWSIGTA